jgi:hypothetical protein
MPWTALAKGSHLSAILHPIVVQAVAEIGPGAGLSDQTAFPRHLSRFRFTTPYALRKNGAAVQRREMYVTPFDPSCQLLAAPPFADHRPQVGEGDRSHQGGSNTPVFAASSPHTAWCHAASIWKWKGAMSS